MDMYPLATYKPLSFVAALAPRIPRKAALLHTNGGGPNLQAWFNQEYAATRSRVGAQYQVLRSGAVECYADPALVLWHAFSASTWAFGIETEDDGNPTTPWTPEQITSIVGILHHHGVPATLLGDGPGDGVGYHEQYHDWNGSGHVCPGPVREAQLRSEVLPRLAAAYRPTPTPVTVPVVHPVPVISAPAWPGRYLRNTSPMMHGADVQRWQAQMANRRWNITADGWYGPRSEQVCREFQAEKHLGVDGIVGPQTWAATWTAPVTVGA